MTCFAVLVIAGIIAFVWFLSSMSDDDSAPIGQMRVIAYTRMEIEYGYAGRHPHKYQELQVRRRWGWETIDKEEVPAWVASYNAIGGADWASKFRYAGSWDRSGIVTPHDTLSLTIIDSKGKERQRA